MLLSLDSDNFSSLCVTMSDSDLINIDSRLEITMEHMQLLLHQSL